MVRAASQTLQETLAAHMLFKAADALGGRDRILAVTGYAAESQTTSMTGLQLDDREWFDVTGRLRRIRKFMGTTIDTLIDGNTADEKVGGERRILSKSVFQDLVASSRRHPLLLIRSYLLGHDRYRLISVRDTGDRQVAIMELIDPERPRLRLHVDHDSGLLRSVERVVEFAGLGTSQILERYRDYRNVSSLRIPFHRSTSHSLPGSGSETQWQKFEVGEQEASVFQRRK